MGKRKITEEQIDMLKQKYQGGCSAKNAGMEFGLSATQSKRILKKLGVIRPRRSVCKSIKDEIMRLYLDELMSPREIGHRVGMTESVVGTHLNYSGKRRSISEAQALVVNKRPHKQGRGGYWQSAKTGKWVYAMSTMELLRIQQHDNNPKVANWDRFVPSVDWEEGRYVPDLYIEYVDGTKVVEEIKPSSQHKYEENKKKWDAARKHFGARGIEFLVVDENMVGGEIAIRTFNYEGLQEINNEERIQRKKEVHDAYRQRNKQRIKNQSRKRYEKYKSNTETYGKMLEASRIRKAAIRAMARSNDSQLSLTI